MTYYPIPFVEEMVSITSSVVPTLLCGTEQNTTLKLQVRELQSQTAQLESRAKAAEAEALANSMATYQDRLHQKCLVAAPTARGTSLFFFRRIHYYFPSCSRRTRVQTKRRGAGGCIDHTACVMFLFLIFFQKPDNKESSFNLQVATAFFKVTLLLRR